MTDEDVKAGDRIATELDGEPFVGVVQSVHANPMEPTYLVVKRRKYKKRPVQFLTALADLCRRIS